MKIMYNTATCTQPTRARIQHICQC